MVRRGNGVAYPLAVERWASAATPGETRLLRGLEGPVLDLGCGPGRLVVALGEAGIPSLGVDASPHAAAWARLRGATVMLRSVFDRLPGEGRWRSALLFDGNIGIGGEPVALLYRIATLLAPRGRVVVETEPPGTPTVHDHVRLEHGDSVGAWFPWTWLGSDDVDTVTARAGLRRHDVTVVEGRWFSTVIKEPIPR
jgi:SAM-dependent methyltransferase